MNYEVKIVNHISINELQIIFKKITINNKALGTKKFQFLFFLFVYYFNKTF